MKLLSMLFSKILIAFIFTIILTTTAFAQQQSVYEVKQGETLYSISKKLDATIAELRQWNNLQGNEIFIGQKLIYYEDDSSGNTEQPAIPANDSESIVRAQSTSDNAFYFVKSGDNLYAISRAHNMTLEQLKALNNLEGDNIRVGQRLTVRKASVAPSVSEFAEESSPQGVFTLYKVQQGEKLEEILQKFRMTEREFRELNAQVNITSLYNGQEVTVLLPPSREYKNPYLQKANLQDLGNVDITTYSSSEAGKSTTNGELYDPESLTAAHSNIALGTVIFVENPASGRGIYVRINDRITGDGLKLSSRAFESLGFKENENATVSIYMED